MYDKQGVVGTFSNPCSSGRLCWFSITDLFTDSLQEVDVVVVVVEGGCLGQ